MIACADGSIACAGLGACSLLKGDFDGGTSVPVTPYANSPQTLNQVVEAVLEKVLKRRRRDQRLLHAYRCWRRPLIRTIPAGASRIRLIRCLLRRHRSTSSLLSLHHALGFPIFVHNDAQAPFLGASKRRGWLLFLSHTWPHPLKSLEIVHSRSRSLLYFPDANFYENNDT